MGADPVRWQLLRVAAIRVGDTPVEEAFVGTVGHAFVQPSRSFSIDGRPGWLMVIAAVPIDTTASESETIRLPDDAIRDAELAIEAFAAILAVDARASHAIHSPEPCVGIVSDDDSFEDLDGRTVHVPGRTMETDIHLRAGLARPEHVEALRDRLDGARLLAEGLNQTTPLGRYSQLLRVFERAFGVGPGAVAAPLAEFLRSGAGRYTREEVQRWADVRGPAVHADRRDDFALSRDVRPLVPRIRDAAYDVLMNKSRWRSPDSARRQQWRPLVGTTPDGVFATAGTAGVTMPVTLLDSFGSFPFLLASGENLMGMLPRAAWLHTDDQAQNTMAVGGTFSPS